MGHSGPETKSIVSKYVSCCNQDSTEYEISWLVVLMAFFKVNIARKCFPDFGGRPGGLEF